MNGEEEDTCGECGDHYRVDIEVDCCNGVHAALGFNFHGTPQDNLSAFATLLLAISKSPEQTAFAESMIGQLQVLFKTKPEKPKGKPGPKVVPIRSPERGPFAEPVQERVSLAGANGCTYIEGPNVMPGWGCCACGAKHPEGMGTYNGIDRDVCKVCGHKVCLPSKTLKAARKKS